MAKGEERKGIVFYYEWQDQILRLPEAYQLQVIKAIWQYDKTGEKIKTEDGLLEVLMEKYYYEIDKQRDNWEAKSGRPAKYTMDLFIPYFEAGMRDSEIASRLGCSAKTVSRKRKEWTKLADMSSKTGQDKEEYVSYVLSKTLSSPNLSNFVQSEGMTPEEAMKLYKEAGF